MKTPTPPKKINSSQGRKGPAGPRKVLACRSGQGIPGPGLEQQVLQPLDVDIEENGPKPGHGADHGPQGQPLEAQKRNGSCGPAPRGS